MAVVRVLGGVVLLLSNGFFVTTEFAMTRVRQFPREAFTGHPGLERAWAMTEELEIYLSGCQLGITISSIGLGVVAEPAVAALIDPVIEAVGLAGVVGGGGGQGGHTALAVILSLALINLAHVVIGEQAPTYLGIERSRLVCRYCAPLLYYWTRVMGPVIRLADWIAKGLLSLGGVTISRSWADEEAGGDAPSRGDLRREMGDRLRGLGLPDERQDEVLAALDIDHVNVENIMVPREDVVSLSTTDSFEQNYDRMKESPHARFPLVDGSLEDGSHDAFVGTIYAPVVLRELPALETGERDLADLATDPVTASAQTTVADFIDLLQERNEELALIEDDGDVVGLVTATDAFEAVMGQLEDPLDEESDGDHPSPDA